MSRVKDILFVAYFCLMMIVLGGTIFSVMVEYPNWFANVPVSIEATRNFYQVLHPGYFFQITGPLMILTGVAFAIVGWGKPAPRNLVLLSIGILIAIELLTFIYIYPRLNIMFGQNAAQSVDALRQAAGEFTFADRIRTLMAVVASGVSIAGLFKFFESRKDVPSWK